MTNKGGQKEDWVVKIRLRHKRQKTCMARTHSKNEELQISSSCTRQSVN